MSPATRVVVSYPADVSDWGRGQLDTRHMRAYLRRHFETAGVGDDWSVFVDVGCCGDSPTSRSESRSSRAARRWTRPPHPRPMTSR